MIGSLVNSLENAKYTMLEQVIHQYGHLLDEQYFIDEGVIATRIKKLQEEHEMIEEQRKYLDYEADASYKEEKLQELAYRQYDVQNKLAYEISNHLEDIDFALGLCHDELLEIGLQGLKAYGEHREKEALQLLNTYFEKYNRVSYHYVLNFVFGKLLVSINQDEVACSYLEQALQLRPDEIEVYELLAYIYNRLGNGVKEQRCHQVMKLLKEGE